MSCSPFDLRDFFFGELSPADRSATETHLSACLLCREELAKLSDLKTVLTSALPDEEPPRRIGFVSDKVFEPSWWQRLWSSGPQLGFAGAALLAIAILVHGVLARPVTSAQPVTARVTTPAAVLDNSAVQAAVKAEVAKVVADRESQQFEKVVGFVNAKLHKVENRNNRDLILIREYLEKLDKRNARVQRAMYE